MSRARALWQRRFLRIVAVVLVAVALVFLAGAYYIPIRPADTVSVTAQYSHQGPSEQIFATVIHDSATVRKVREIFEAARGPINSTAGIDCSLPANQIYTYEFEFTWQGLTTESVHWELLNCAFIDFTRWGNPFPQTYAGLGQNQYDELVRLTGIPADSRY